ncbi:MAG: PrsW family intramembrane metalloprotease [Spirochaetaceae bacterium]|nr:PrsW family intramembrane metalloprotease [Spirochaetaceae bacterium]
MATLLRIGICFLPVLTLFLLSRRFVPAFQVSEGFVAVLSGLASVIPVVLIQQGIRLLLNLAGAEASYAFTCFVSSSFVEESVKAGVLAAVFRKKPSFLVFCAAAVLAGFSFGGFEAVLYLFSGGGNTLLRLVTAVALHGFCALLGGFTVWTLYGGGFRFSSLLPLVFAVLLHGLYNFFAGISGGLQWFSLVCIAAAVNQCVVYYRKLTIQNL